MAEKDDVLIVEDERTGEGPLQGLITSLERARGERVMVSPCDTPLLRADICRLLIDSSEGRDGAVPARQLELPFSVQGMVRCAHEFGRLTVDAALSGDRDLVFQAAMAHPAHRDMKIMEEVIAKLFEAHKEFLPQFNAR